MHDEILSHPFILAKKFNSNMHPTESRRSLGPISVDQVSPAILSATRDVAFVLERLVIKPAPEEVLNAVLDRAEHLEEQASGITVLEA